MVPRGLRTDSVISLIISDQIAKIVTSDASDPEINSQEIVDLTGEHRDW